MAALCLLLACSARAELKLFMKGTDPREVSELESLLVKEVGEELALTRISWRRAPRLKLPASCSLD